MITKYKSKARTTSSTGKPSMERKGDRRNNTRNNNSRNIVKKEQVVFNRKSEKDEVKVIVLGGLEEVGRNMTIIECNKEILIIDMGLQFPEENMPGIDYIIPNIEYLKDKKDWIKGVIITHGHMDHIGAIPHLIGEIGNPPIFMGKLTAGLVRKRCEQFKGCPVLNSQEIDENSHVKLGSFFRTSFLRVNHSIPDCFAIIIETPLGKIIHTGDFKIDYSPVNDKPADLQRIANIGSTGVLLLMADSTDATHPGYQVSESAIGTEMDSIFENITGRIILGTFASQLSRIQKLFDLAAKYNRQVYLQGRTMNTNVEVAHQIGYLKFNPKILANDADLRKLPDNKILIIGTGAQGESNAFLSRVVAHEHKTIHLKKGDTVIFSSSVIPGNERSIQNLKDMMARQNAHIIHYEMMDVHAGGHAKQEDLKLMMRLLKPKYMMPIEGNHYLLRAHAELAEKVGIPTENIFIPDNGQLVVFNKSADGFVKGEKIKETIPADYVFVDGLGVGDVSNIVLRDRKVMSEDGMVVIIATIDSKTGKTIGNPDIISRGFVYMKESKDLIEATRMKVKKLVETNNTKTSADLDHVKNKIRDEMGQFLFSKTKRRPMVLPVAIKV